ncbi:Protein of unknown function [Psychroflexus salarius]|uniref:DUF2975 domain-containing protein n=1 Tax=Psychroflexus salarius TaxID=1155689 RepID=A0A1M4V008_9FLAO|nr:DUF2975 domain-containing protein [Psychroflexus salarius]SHE62217.1 Protein of unknown function [Psychroflexus salarius]
MKTSLKLLYVGVQFLRLVLSACIVVYTYLFFNDIDDMLTSYLRFALISLPVFIFWVFAFSALNKIVPVIKRCLNQDFFAPENAKSIRFLAYVLIIYAIGSPILNFVFKVIEHGKFELSLAFDIEHAFVSHFALGLILLILAQIINRGRTLEIDQKLTI